MSTGLTLGHTADWWGGAVIVVALLSALVIALVSYAAWTAQKRQASADRDSLNRYKVSEARRATEAEVKLKDADVKAKEAEAASALAREKAADANKQAKIAIRNAAEANEKAVVIQLHLAEANARIVETERRTAQANKRAAALEKEANDAKLALAKVTNHVGHISAGLSSRHLTPMQRQAIQNLHLRNFSVSVIADNGGEVESFAREIATAFQDSGATVSLGTGNTTVDSSRVGLIVKLDTRNPTALAIFSAMERADLQPQPLQSEQTGIIIEVAMKPNTF